MNKLFSTLILALALVAGAFGQVTGGGSVVSGGSVKQVPAGSSPTGGPGSSTDYALAAWNGTGGNLLRNTTLITDANGDLTMPSTATTGFRLFNTVDQTTNVTRLEQVFSGGIAGIGTRTLGTGTSATLSLYAQTGSGGAFYTRLDVLDSANFPWVRIGGYTSPTGTTKFNTGNAGSMIVLGDATIGTTSGQVNVVAITPTYNETSGNAANTDLLINRTQTAVGSGTQRLLDLQVGSSSKFNVDNGGSVTMTGRQITTPSALTYASPTSVDVTLASCYTVTTVNATGSVTFNATAGGTAGQDMTILITNDPTSAKTITFGTNFLSTGTLTAGAVSRHTSITFKSDGTSWYETGRAVLLN